MALDPAFGVFDGIDLDWEWPATEGNVGNVIRPEDKANFLALVQEFRSQLNAYGSTVGKTYELTAFLPADIAKIDAGIAGGCLQQPHLRDGPGLRLLRCLAAADQPPVAAAQPGRQPGSGEPAVLRGRRYSAST